MTRSTASVFPDWPQYARRLGDAVSGLDAASLALRAGPEHAPIWALAAHVAGTRVFWLCGIFGRPGAERTPFPAPLTEPGWEDDESQPRSGRELAWALDSSWAIVAETLEAWSVDDLAVTAVRRRPDGSEQLHSRASVLNRICSHDAFHAGEISQLLGLHHLPPIDLWVRNVSG